MKTITDYIIFLKTAGVLNFNFYLFKRISIAISVMEWFKEAFNSRVNSFLKAAANVLKNFAKNVYTIWLLETRSCGYQRI
jgi:hypothetical protein